MDKGYLKIELKDAFRHEDIMEGNSSIEVKNMSSTMCVHYLVDAIFEISEEFPFEVGFLVEFMMCFANKLK